MHPFSAFSGPILSLLLVLVDQSSITAVAFKVGEPFLSAKTENLCGKLYDGGYGFGRTTWETIAAHCEDRAEMSLRCTSVLPTKGEERESVYECKSDQVCVTTDGADAISPDAGCISVPTREGLVAADDQDRRACSAGFTVGPSGLHGVRSQIRPAIPELDDTIESCSVIRSGTNEIASTSKDCDEFSQQELNLLPGTYQACLTVQQALNRVATAFYWILILRNGIKKRDDFGMEEVLPLSELVTIEKRAEPQEGPSVEIQLVDERA
ncbi:hypothetical protein EJ03DRAFT_328969 [Teratosphaeria nubilosa]|uniref:Uncharacterized protein n=1 Tax=Teratosphaeria nubilosa TaxID=161662 RepID=A0A6G1L6B4_9PEZI|nr:hypothetical protein EJ03DRAFT_328969 [Teratosphaeria nubilosa]